MAETERLLIDNLERHSVGDAATANLIADAAKALRAAAGGRDALRKHADALAGVCETFLGHDNRFQIAVGGNPIAVDAMLDASRSTLAAYTAYLIDGEEG